MTQYIHPTAQTGFEHGAQAYTKGRPDYPMEALYFLESDLGLSRESRVLEVGAGTGKFTQLMHHRGWNVTAVEPVPGMRAEFASLLPQVPIVDGSAERLPFADASFDAVVAAQAFHWFRGAEALNEFARALRPGGHLALIWNARDESVPWVQELTTLFAPFEGETPRYSSGRWRGVFSEPSLFSPLLAKSFRYDHRGNVDILVDRVASISFIAALDESRRAKVLDQVRALGERIAGPGPGAPLLIPYRTDLYWCSKTARS